MGKGAGGVMGEGWDHFRGGGGGWLLGHGPWIGDELSKWQALKSVELDMDITSIYYKIIIILP